MSTLFKGVTRKVVRDSGDEVTIVDMPFARAYRTEESQRLSREYDVDSHPGFVSSSLGSSGLESFVGHLFRLYSFMGEFCGFCRTDLADFTQKSTGRIDYFLRLNAGGFLKEEQIEGEEVVFPTEAFLENQRIKKR